MCNDFRAANGVVAVPLNVYENIVNDPNSKVNLNKLPHPPQPDKTDEVYTIGYTSSQPPYILIPKNAKTIDPHILQMRQLDLATAIDVCGASEIATRQLKVMTSSESVQRIDATSKRSRSKPRSQSHKSAVHERGRSAPRRCRYCDRDHEPQKEACPAYGQACRQCGKMNHFASCCLMKQQTGNFRQGTVVTETTGSVTCQQNPTIEELLTITGVDRKRLFSRLIVCDRSVRFQLDCGATVNLLPLTFVRSIDPNLKSQRPAASTLRMYDQSILQTGGMMSAQVTHPLTKQVSMLEFYVATKHNQPILGLEACLLFDLLAINEENICVVNPTLPTAGSSLTKECVVNRYPDLFVGYGTLPGEVRLEVDPNV